MSLRIQRQNSAPQPSQDENRIESIPVPIQSTVAVDGPQTLPVKRLQAAVRNLRRKIQHTEQCQDHDRQVQSQSAALPFVTTGVLNCTLIANNVDDLVDLIDTAPDWTARTVLLMVTIIVLLLVQFGIVGVLSYLFYLGSVATTLSDDYTEGGVDKEHFELESRRIRKLKNTLHAVMLILALSASVLEVVYLSLAKDFYA